MGSFRREGPTTTSSVKGSTMGGSDNTRRMVRNLPYPAFLKRREEEQCFRCGGPFTPCHRCSERSLRVPLLAEDEEHDAGDGVEPELKSMELDYGLTEALTQPKTMKLTGWIGGRSVVELINSGGNHNFVSRELVEELK